MNAPPPNSSADEGRFGVIQSTTLPGDGSPSVLAPFPAPPVEGSGVRLGWGLGIAGLVLVLCCGGGLAAVIGLFTTQVAAINEQASVVISDYLNALRDDDYDTAYDLLCGARQQEVSKAEFTREESDRSALSEYNVGEATITPDSTIGVAVTEQYADGTEDRVTYYLEADQQTGQLKICGRE